MHSLSRTLELPEYELIPGVEAGFELKSVSVVHLAIESHGVGENQMSGLELVSVSVSLAFESENSGVGQLALELRMN